MSVESVMLPNCQSAMGFWKSNPWCRDTDGSRSRQRKAKACSVSTGVSSRRDVISEAPEAKF